MFQSFDAPTNPADGPPRLDALRQAMASAQVEAFLVPRADAHQGEYVADCDARLAWLTGFTGSAGQCVVTADKAALFVDGRYPLQARAQTAEVFDVVLWSDQTEAAWLAGALPKGARVAYDPWLHTANQIETLAKKLSAGGIELRPTPNLIDQVWTDRPARPEGKVIAYPKALAGKGDISKRREIAENLRDAGHAACVLTLPDSICWLLNIRGADIPRNPIVQAFAIVHAKDGRVDLISTPSKFADLGPDPDITMHHWDDLEEVIKGLSGAVRIDKNSAPIALKSLLQQPVFGDDPCILPKACKTDAEITATRAAHMRDAAAMVEFLAWLDAADTASLTEIDVVKALEGFRQDTGALRDISFDTICGSGPNGAIVHYRVTEQTNRSLDRDSLLLVDSGGQYLDGTTDITRTVALGTPNDDMKRCFTAVLRGMIAISQAKFPKGCAGRDLDALARQHLWAQGLDYGHGTGHGVGVYLCVHEGPQRISRMSEQPLKPGMILSNEPGYYREGAFGIRIENLIVVREARDTQTPMYDFETLTWVPIDPRLIDVDALSADERAWINSYHAEIAAKLDGALSPGAAAWLARTVTPL
ncbi:aminopeptidase P family protein [Nereida sp. MMG025]|uniref:aminopeptidase P family protein n=1 Tax=Nereida sp. MMG025 TaxID=2909981 RepID=UPI001F4037B6|nr:aminopeptidase P family protein [Nereida sp. MMG025]MCF6445245.1 aminopeptidase P family protein [Nereida sp. MMG025]